MDRIIVDGIELVIPEENPMVIKSGTTYAVTNNHDDRDFLIHWDLEAALADPFRRPVVAAIMTAWFDTMANECWAQSVVTRSEVKKTALHAEMHSYKLAAFDWRKFTAKMK